MLALRCIVTNLTAFIFVIFICARIPCALGADDGLPEIQPFHFPSRLTEGSSAKVLCNVLLGKRPVRFEWQKNGVLLKGDGNKKVNDQEDFSMLIVDNIKSTDTGNYTCLAKNNAGSSSHTARLVVEAVPTWVTAPTDATGLYASSLGIPCVAAGLPAPRVTWHRGRDVIAGGSGRVVAHGDGTLQLHSLHKEDEGSYRCKAENDVGEPITKEIKITVNGISYAAV